MLVGGHSLYVTCFRSTQYIYPQKNQNDRIYYCSIARQLKANYLCSITRQLQRNGRNPWPMAHGQRYKYAQPGFFAGKICDQIEMLRAPRGLFVYMALLYSTSNPKPSSDKVWYRPYCSNPLPPVSFTPRKKDEGPAASQGFEIASNYSIWNLSSSSARNNRKQSDRRKCVNGCRIYNIW